MIDTVADMASVQSRSGGPCVLVPTMGALHAGHVALIERARTLAGKEGRVVVSIFVNPTQFGPKEDLDAYPRPLQRDLEKCEAADADIVFHPASSDVYATDRSVTVSENSLSKLLCGASRPGHFDGVCTIVLKLFNIIRPDIAVFGKKDYQQLAIIRRFVRDLNVPVEIVGVETVREPGGLAKSSRNVYLTDAERAQAPILRAVLLETAAAAAAGQTNTDVLRQSALRALRQRATLGTIDYVEIVDADSLQQISEIGHSSLMALAVFFGTTRLIDNIELAPA